MKLTNSCRIQTRNEFVEKVLHFVYWQWNYENDTVCYSHCLILFVILIHYAILNRHTSWISLHGWHQKLLCIIIDAVLAVWKANYIFQWLSTWPQVKIHLSFTCDILIHIFNMTTMGVISQCYFLLYFQNKQIKC